MTQSQKQQKINAFNGTRITKNIESAYVTHSYKLRQDGRSSIKVDRKIAAISAMVALTKLTYQPQNR